MWTTCTINSSRHVPVVASWPVQVVAVGTEYDCGTVGANGRLEEEYVVEKILQEKCVKGRCSTVKWEGYEAIEDQTWEPAVHMANTEALMAWKKGKAKTPGNVPASSKTPGKGTVGEYDDGNDDDDEEEEEDSEADGGEWKPKATSASRSEPAKKKTTPKVAASGKSPATAAAASKKRPLEEVLPEALPEKLDVQVILSQIEGWDAPALKALAALPLQGG